MQVLLTAAQMRALEQETMDDLGLSGADLMERAGRGAVDAILAHWPELQKGRRHGAVLCGPGNNGGDGFVVARILVARGWDVACFLLGDPDALSGDAELNYGRWSGMGEFTLPLDQFTVDGPPLDLVVDALFGTGLSRPLRGAALGAAHTIATMRDLRDAPRIVALDMPSGICADSGQVLRASAMDSPARCAFEAGLTVAFETAKPGHYLSDGGKYRGVLRIVRLDLHYDLDELSARTAVCDAFQPPPAALVGPSPGILKSDGHKYDHGHALVLSGGPGRGGAARMAARGALRIGAGLVTLGCPPGALQENAGRLDAVMIRSVKGVERLAEMLADDERLSAICIGPGFGVEAARAAAPAVLKSGRATVLDGDALTAFADDPRSLFDALHPACVLTPHMGEFARLFPDLAERLGRVPIEGPAFSKLDAAREAASRSGCVVLLKGADTVIAAPDGKAAVNAAQHDRAVPWLATAGAGDVLAGFITGLLARGGPPFQAACDAAWLHVECARRFGPGLIAEDLPDMLPAVLGDLFRSR